MNVTAAILKWNQPLGPRDPRTFRAIVDHIESATGVLLISDIPSEAGSRITYLGSATLGVLDTISRRQWLGVLTEDPTATMVAGDVLKCLAEMERDNPGVNLTAQSLLARRLLVLGQYHIDVRDPLAIREFLTLDGGRLPAPACIPSPNHA